MERLKKSPAQFGDVDKALTKKVKEIIAQEEARHYAVILRNSILKGTFLAAFIIAWFAGLSIESNPAFGMLSIICSGYGLLFAVVNKGKWIFA